MCVWGGGGGRFNICQLDHYASQPFLILLLITVCKLSPLPPAPPPLGSPCSHSQFVCALSGSCIPMAVRCDGRRDCAGSEDEQGCGE